MPRTKQKELDFFIDNNFFGSGDAEYWYNLIRLKKPRRILEIGSGHSTLMARRAIKANEDEVLNYSCQHTCIEPYENLWLEKTGVSVIRQKAEEAGKEAFMELQSNDILFIVF